MYDFFYGVLIIAVFFFGYRAVKNNPDNEAAVWIKKHKIISVFLTLVALSTLAPSDEPASYKGKTPESIAKCERQKRFFLSVIKARDKGTPREVLIRTILEDLEDKNYDSITQGIVPLLVAMVYDNLFYYTKENIESNYMDECLAAQEQDPQHD
jgi:hypothetical protein